MTNAYICEPSVRDALCQSPYLSLTSKRTLFGVDKAFRELLGKHFGGKLDQIYLHRSDCTASNADFLLTGRLAYKESSEPDWVFKGVDGWTLDMASLNDTCDVHVIDVWRMEYAAAFFLGHALAHFGHSSQTLLRTANGGQLSSLTGLVANRDKRRWGSGSVMQSENRSPFGAVLRAGTLREAHRRISLLAHEVGDVKLSHFLLDDEAMGRVAHKIHKKMDMVREIYLVGNPFGPAGLRSLFEPWIAWPSLQILNVGSTWTGVGSALLKVIESTRGAVFPKLADLDLHNTGLRNVDMYTLWDVLPFFKELATLDLSDNPFDCAAFAPLARFDETCKHDYRERPMESLQELGLRELGAMKFEGYAVLASALQDGCFPNLRYIAAPAKSSDTGALQMALRTIKYQRKVNKAARKLKIQKQKTETCIVCGPVFYSPTSPYASRSPSPRWDSTSM